SRPTPFRILDSNMPLSRDPEFEHGIALFNAGEFFQAHEELEIVWTPVRGPRRFFLQSLIHLAVGFYHHRNGNQVGARLQPDKALRKLAAYLPRYETVDTAAIYCEAVEALARIERGETIAAFPRIRRY